MNENEIRNCLKTQWIGRELRYHETTGSTNEDVVSLLEEGAKEGVLVVAGSQSRGRGRRGRDWQSPPDTNIYMTLGLRPKFAPDMAPAVTLVMALAVVKALEECCGQDSQIKWPNDIVINGKKVCGILTEMSLLGGAIHHVIIGVGINVNGAEFPEEIRQTATSLCMEKGEKMPRAFIVAKTMEYFEAFYEKFLQTQDMSGLKEAYTAYLVNVDKKVRVLDPGQEFEGVAQGIDDKGQLLVQKDDGSVVAVYAGEVSVRGVYGYV